MTTCPVIDTGLSLDLFEVRENDTGFLLIVCRSCRQVWVKDPDSFGLADRAEIEAHAEHD